MSAARGSEGRGRRAQPPVHIDSTGDTLDLTILVGLVVLVAAATALALSSARGMGSELARLTYGQDGEL